MCNEKDLLAFLVTFLTGYLWHKNTEVAQNVHLAIWWIKKLQENADLEKVGFLQRTVNHQTNRLREIARKQKQDHMLSAQFDEGLKQTMVDLNLAWYPEPPKPQRINELPLVRSFKKLGDVRTCEVTFTRKDGENRWYGYMQDGGRDQNDVWCEGQVAYRQFERTDGVGGRHFVIVPLAVRVDVPEWDDDNQGGYDFAHSLRKQWKDPNLFPGQVFLRHCGPNSVAHREITTIQSQRVKRAD